MGLPSASAVRRSALMMALGLAGACGAVQSAHAHGGQIAVGTLFGAGAGAVVGQAFGGQQGAVVGSVVGAGTELFRLIRQGRLEWRAEVTAAEIGRIPVGAPVQIKAASGQVLQGKVRMVAPSVDAQTRNALVYVDLPAQAGSARAGMYAQGEIALGQSQALTVPQSAVVVRDGFSYVYAVGPDQKVSQLKVQTGRQSAGRVEVTSGLKADARVVASGGAFLNHGDTVRVVDAPASTPASK